MRRITALTLSLLVASFAYSDLILNGDFQEGDVGWFGAGITISNWTYWGTSGWHTDDMGADNLNIKIWSSDTGIFQDFAGTPGQVYSYSVDIMRSPGSGDQPQGWEAYLKAEFLDASYAQLDAYTVGTLSPDGPSGVWYNVSGVATAPAGTVYGRIVLGLNDIGDPNAGAFYFDNASVDVIPEPTTTALLALGGVFGFTSRRRRRG